MKIENTYKKWISGADENTVSALKSMSESEKQDSFYKNIKFGTGGMRGLLGAGTNRINKYTIVKATKGFAEYIKANGKTACKNGVVIAYDNRMQSRELSETTAGVLAYEGIRYICLKI